MLPNEAKEPIDRPQTVLKAEEPIDRLQTVLKVRGRSKQAIEEPIDRLQTILKAKEPIDTLQKVLKVRGRSKEPGHWISLYKRLCTWGSREHLESDS